MERHPQPPHNEQERSVDEIREQIDLFLADSTPSEQRAIRLLMAEVEQNPEARRGIFLIALLFNDGLVYRDFVRECYPEDFPSDTLVQRASRYFSELSPAHTPATDRPVDEDFLRELQSLFRGHAYLRAAELRGSVERPHSPLVKSRAPFEDPELEKAQSFAEFLYEERQSYFQLSGVERQYLATCLCDKGTIREENFSRVRERILASADAELVTEGLASYFERLYPTLWPGDSDAVRRAMTPEPWKPTAEKHVFF